MPDKTDSVPKQPGNPPNFACETHPLNQIKRTIGVLSGKGGVGKSLVTGLAATYLQRGSDRRIGILDADITGPTIPRLFGADQFRPRTTDEGIFPVRTHSDIQLMSINLLLEDPSKPVIWRGPILANTVKQFWSDVIWGDLDYLMIDMPPGTGDIPLTIFQSLPIDGIIIVTSPQDLVAMIVKKAINMASMMNIPVIGIVENMSFIECPHCGKTIELFGHSNSREVAAAMKVPFLDQVALDPDLSALCDRGHIERYHKEVLPETTRALLKLPEHH